MSDAQMIWDEVNKVNAGTAQGQQSIMMQLEMKAWAIKVGMWPNAEYKDIVDAHAEARGWSQSDVDGMQLIY